MQCDIVVKFTDGTSISPRTPFGIREMKKVIVYTNQSDYIALTDEIVYHDSLYDVGDINNSINLMDKTISETKQEVTSDGIGGFAQGKYCNIALVGLGFMDVSAIGLICSVYFNGDLKFKGKVDNYRCDKEVYTIRCTSLAGSYSGNTSSDKVVVGNGYTDLDFKWDVYGRYYADIGDKVKVISLHKKVESLSGTYYSKTNKIPVVSRGKVLIPTNRDLNPYLSNTSSTNLSANIEGFTGVITYVPKVNDPIKTLVDGKIYLFSSFKGTSNPTGPEEVFGVCEARNNDTTYTIKFPASCASTKFIDQWTTTGFCIGDIDNPPDRQGYVINQAKFTNNCVWQRSTTFGVLDFPMPGVVSANVKTYSDVMVNPDSCYRICAEKKDGTFEYIDIVDIVPWSGWRGVYLNGKWVGDDNHSRKDKVILSRSVVSADYTNFRVVDSKVVAKEDEVSYPDPKLKFVHRSPVKSLKPYLGPNSSVLAVSKDSQGFHVNGYFYVDWQSASVKGDQAYAGICYPIYLDYEDPIGLSKDLYLEVTSKWGNSNQRHYMFPGITGKTEGIWYCPTKSYRVLPSPFDGEASPYAYNNTLYGICNNAVLHKYVVPYSFGASRITNLSSPSDYGLKGFSSVSDISVKEDNKPTLCVLCSTNKNSGSNNDTHINYFNYDIVDVTIVSTYEASDSSYSLLVTPSTASSNIPLNISADSIWCAADILVVIKGSTVSTYRIGAGWSFTLVSTAVRHADDYFYTNLNGLIYGDSSQNRPDMVDSGLLWNRPAYVETNGQGTQTWYTSKVWYLSGGTWVVGSDLGPGAFPEQVTFTDAVGYNDGIISIVNGFLQLSLNSSNPVNVIESIASTSSKAEIANNAVAKTARLQWKCNAASVATNANNLIDMISKNHALMTYESYDGKVHVDSIYPIPENYLELTEDDILLDGDQLSITEETMSIDFLSTGLITKFDGLTIDSNSNATAAAFNAEAQKTLGFPAKVELKLTTCSDRVTIDNSQIAKSYYHSKPPVIFRMRAKLQNIDIGQYVGFVGSRFKQSMLDNKFLVIDCSHSIWGDPHCKIAVMAMPKSPDTTLEIFEQYAASKEYNEVYTSNTREFYEL